MPTEYTTANRTSSPSLWSEMVAASELAASLVARLGRYSDARAWRAIMGMRGMNMVSSAATTRPIRRIVLHALYDQFTSDYDIALLELATPVVFSEMVQPVCVPASTHAFGSGTSCFVTGWGVLTEDGDSSTGRNTHSLHFHIQCSWSHMAVAVESPDIFRHPSPPTVPFSGELATLLQEAPVKIISHNTCNKLYDDAVTPRMLCAGNLQGGVDACQVSVCVSVCRFS